MTSSPKKNASPRRMSREARREQLLGHARDEFVASGFHDASMDAIASRAGVSKPVLYQHFPGKRELYLTLLDDAVAQLKSVLELSLKHGDNPETLVHDTLNVYFGLAGAHDSGLRLALRADSSNDNEASARLRDLQQWTIDAVTERLYQVASIPDPPARALAIGVVGLAQTAARAWFLSEGENRKQEEVVELYSRLVWGGLKEFAQQYAAGAAEPSPAQSSHTSQKDAAPFGQ